MSWPTLNWQYLSNYFSQFDILFLCFVIKSVCFCVLLSLLLNLIFRGDDFFFWISYFSFLLLYCIESFLLHHDYTALFKTWLFINWIYYHHLFSSSFSCVRKKCGFIKLEHEISTSFDRKIHILRCNITLQHLYRK